MKILFDFFPVILFFVTFKLYEDPQQGVLAATAVAIVAASVQVALVWWQKRRVEKVHIITLALILVLGGATLAFRDPVFIKWKPTAVNWLFAVVFVGSQFVGDKPIVQRMMGHSVTLTRAIWHRLNVMWAAFFTAMGFANLYVAFNFDLATWVDFKMWGILGLTLVFVFLQALYLTRHVKDDAANANEE